MTTLPTTRAHGKVPDEWPQKTMDNRRKTSSHAATITGNIWGREMYPNSPRYANSNAYHQDCAHEHDTRSPEEKSSLETVVEVEETGANKNNIPNYPDETVYVKVVPKHNNTTVRDKYQRFYDYSDYNMPEATTAMQKLQQLKELQRKRDISEKYYSQEIKRLIGEYYFGSKIASPSIRSTRRLQSSSFHPSSGDRLRNNLEPCGTMTTITRLYCGCIQETTRPIFTTARGRVQRRSCNQSQNDMLLKLTSSNPQEHLFSSLEQPTRDRYRTKTKKRLPPEPRMCTKIAPGGDQEFETETEKKTDEPEREIFQHISRTTSPQRKFSDTSATSC